MNPVLAHPLSECLKLKEALSCPFVGPLKSPPNDFAYIMLFDLQNHSNANYKKKYNNINTENLNYSHSSCLKNNQCKNIRFLRHIKLRQISGKEIKFLLKH